MKFTHRILILLAILAGISMPSKAQDDIDKLFQEGVQDGSYLLKGYLDPFMKSLSTGLNQGWYNTAENHKFPGFDLTITANVMYIPDKETSYYVDNNRLNTVQLDGGSGNVPTLFGDDTPPIYRINVPDLGEEPTFEGPPGLNLKEEIGRNILPVPMAHLGIGLPKGFDLKIRWAPTVNLGDDGTFKIFGLGVMHNVKQYIPGLKLLPFDLAGFVGYTSMKIDYDLSESDFQGDNQKGVFRMSATTIQGLISKKFSVVTFYGGLGYNIAKSRMAMEGTYDFNQDGDRGNAGDPGEKDPVELKFGASGPRVTAGMRLKLAILTLHADYTIQKYNALTVGIGFSVR